MRSIQVRGLIAPDAGSVITSRRLHTLFLGNGRRLQFPSEREAAAAQADVNRFLNEQLQELNWLLGRGYADYRAAWPLFWADGQPLLEAVEQRVREALKGADWCIDRAVRGTMGPNGMHFAWKHLGDASAHLVDAGRALGEVYRYKTQGVLRHHVAMAERQAEAVGERLRDYGSTG